MNKFKICALVILGSFAALNCCGRKPEVSNETVDAAPNNSSDAIPDAAPDLKRQAEEKEQMEVSLLYCPSYGGGDVALRSTEYVPMSSLKEGATACDLANVLAKQLASKFGAKTTYDSLPCNLRASFMFSKYPQSFKFCVPKTNHFFILRELTAKEVINFHKKIKAQLIER